MMDFFTCNNTGQMYSFTISETDLNTFVIVCYLFLYGL